MRNTVVICASLLLSAAFVYGQGELAPSIDSGPLPIGPESQQSDQLIQPKPDSEGVYSLGPGITLPAVLHAVSAASSEDIPSCEPPTVIVAAVIGVDGKTSVVEFFTPRSSACAKPAILAIKQSRFQPAKLNNLPVPVRACLHVPFESDQPSIPSFVRCPPESSSDRREESDSFPVNAKETTDRRELAMPETGPADANTAMPVPDDHGVYLMGPGIKSPTMKSAGEAAPADAVAVCSHPVIVSAVLAIDGTIKVGGVYEIYHPVDKACDNLAIAAVEKSMVQPATLNGLPVPVYACLGLPFARPVTPVARPVRCPPNVGPTPVGGPDAFLLRPGTKLPVVISTPPPPGYTFEARKKKIHGVVTVSALVTEEGLATGVQIVKGLGYGLDEIALDTARQYRFRPATLGGKPVPVRTNIEVEFNLHNN